jgi:hypothetical protein
VLGVAEGKISGARSKAVLAAEKAAEAAEHDQVAATTQVSSPTAPVLFAWLNYYGFADCYEQLDEFATRSVSLRRDGFVAMSRAQRMTWLSRLLGDFVDLHADGASQFSTESCERFADLRRTAADGIASIAGCETWQEKHTRCCDVQAQLVTSTLRVLLCLAQVVFVPREQASHSLLVAETVTTCVDEATSLLVELYDAVEFCGTERENLRHGNLLLADHSHAVTALDEGARCAYAVADVARQRLVVEAMLSRSDKAWSGS